MDTVKEPVAPGPGPGILASLRSGFWTTSNGRKLAFSEMTTDHLWNALGWLRWYAPEVAAYLPDNGAFDDPAEAVAAEPAWSAIGNELSDRAELVCWYEALSVMRNQGEVPWERSRRLKRRRAEAARARRAVRKALDGPENAI